MRAVIPLTRLVIDDDEISAVTRVLRSGHVAQGPEVTAFEEEFAALVSGRHCAAVNSGTLSAMPPLTDTQSSGLAQLICSASRRLPG
jgi:dTDP-4-amino-4,6-dideoxygalactose transaminase